MKELQLQWREANPEKCREIGRENSRRRRARKLDQLGTVTRTAAGILKAQGDRCAAPGCHRRIKLVDSHLDHIVPLASGGFHDDANLQVLCADCNLSKGAKDPFEFARSRGALL